MAGLSQWMHFRRAKTFTIKITLMPYIKNNSRHEIGDVVVTERTHSSLAGTFTKGSKVKVVDIDPIRGYSIEDENGNCMCEIGWVI